MGFLAFLIVVALFVLVLSGVVQWPGDRRTSLNTDPGIAVRLARMENSLRLLESRLDSLEDQQQFLERLLSDRPEQRALPTPGPGEGSPAEPTPADDTAETSILFDIDLHEPDDPRDGDEDDH